MTEEGARANERANAEFVKLEEEGNLPLPCLWRHRLCGLRRVGRGRRKEAARVRPSFLLPRQRWERERERQSFLAPPRS